MSNLCYEYKDINTMSQ